MSDPDISSMVMGAAVTGFGSLIFYWVKGYFDGKKERVKLTEKTIQANRLEGKSVTRGILDELKRLNSEMTDIRLKLSNDAGTQKEQQARSELGWTHRFAEIAAKLDVLSANLQQTAKDTNKIEGRIEEHMRILVSQTSALTHMEKQMARLYEITDDYQRIRSMIKHSAASDDSASRG